MNHHGLQSHYCIVGKYLDRQSSVQSMQGSPLCVRRVSVCPWHRAGSLPYVALATGCACGGGGCAAVWELLNRIYFLSVLPGAAEGT